MTSADAPRSSVLDVAGDVGELTAAVCDIESVSGNEQALAQALIDALQPLPHLEVSRHGNAVVARVQPVDPRQADQPPVIIAGHLDTVPVAGNLPTWRTQEQGRTWLHGRGTVDMKGGVAVALHLAATVTSPRLPVTYLWYDNEEVAADLNGLARLAVEHPHLLQGQLAILMEPTDGVIEAGCQGSLRMRLDLIGQAAHSARAWQGVNAVHQAGLVLHALQHHQPRQVPMGPVTYREGLNAVGVAGGTGLGAAANVIPDRCELTLNYRFAPDLSLAQAQEYVLHLVEQALGPAGGSTPASWSVHVLDASAAAHPGLDQPVVQQFISVMEQPVRAKYGWTDVARFAALGVPALNYGPGDPNLAHRDDERVVLEQIKQCAQQLRGWLEQHGN